METTKFIAVAFFALFAGGTPPGMINMSVAKITLAKNKKNGLYAALGAFSANLIQAFICILLAQYLTQRISIQANMLKISVFIFAGLLIYFIYEAIRNKPVNSDISKKDSRKSFAKGFLITSLNVLIIPYMTFIGTRLHKQVENAFDPLHIFLFCFSTAAGTFTILYLYIIMVQRLKKRMRLLAKYANIFMAFLMFVLLIISLFRLYAD